ncbi:hypothetical protein [Sphingomonas sanxanigenens]|nr:hypothetical protein [Sphingomonas sanxanigenens]
MTNRMLIGLPAATAALLLAGCSGEAENAQTSAIEISNTSRPKAARPEDQEPGAIEELGPADRRTALRGELGCSFADGRGRTLLMAKGNVGGTQPSDAIVRIGGAIHRVAAAGGFNAMVKGASFSGDGLSFTVKATAPTRGGGESPSQPARLTYTPADGAKDDTPKEKALLKVNGFWQCGP